ncbi:MAG: DNA-directed RNA polymerase subunit omega [Clostridiales bacterium]|jgi:DNA-directed RNA polymerase subunit K/omega|nr:DNA-directed RNA polymerase subunit omega [Clostridiales bacterium]
MLIDPPIDKLIEQNGKYELCVLVSKRARYLMDKMPLELDDSGLKAITYATREVYEGRVIPVVE